MIWKLAALWLVVGAVILLVVVPTSTVTVRFDLPPGPDGAPVSPPSDDQVRAASAYVIGVTQALLIAIPLAIGAWLTRRIVTRARARKAAAQEPHLDR
jgi:hypothetical protein